MRIQKIHKDLQSPDEDQYKITKNYSIADVKNKLNTETGETRYILK